MLEDTAIAVSTGAAGNIVSYMFQGQVDVLRAQVAKIFRHGTEQELTSALQAVERDAESLSEHNVTRAALTSQWTDALLSYLTDHPESRADIEAVALPRITGGTVTIGNQIHIGNGPQIARDNYGSMTFGGGRNNG